MDQIRIGITAKNFYLWDGGIDFIATIAQGIENDVSAIPKAEATSYPLTLALFIFILMSIFFIFPPPFSKLLLTYFHIWYIIIIVNKKE